MLINNAGNAHLGELGSYEAIADAKGEIIEGLADGGTVVLNKDDKFFARWKALAEGRKVMTFGLNGGADVSAHYQLNASNSLISITLDDEKVEVELKSPGLHNVQNALAATAAGLAVGVDINAVKKGLSNYSGTKGRLQYKQALHGAVVIDDTYNANPMSVRAAIDVLKAHQGQTVLVLGDMGELGSDAKSMHQEVGAYAKKEGIDVMHTLGDLSQESTNAFGKGSEHFDAIEALIISTKKIMDKSTMVLVKGSRYMAMERVVSAIEEASSHAKGVQ